LKAWQQHHLEGRKNQGLLSLIRYVLLKTMNEKRMKKKLLGFLTLVEQLQHSLLRALAQTLTSWL